MAFEIERSTSKGHLKDRWGMMMITAGCLQASWRVVNVKGAQEHDVN